MAFYKRPPTLILAVARGSADYSDAVLPLLFYPYSLKEIMLTRVWALSVAAQWCDAWNKRDIDALMALHADDAELNSPLVAKRWNVADGWIRGKAHLRKNFEIGMQTPGMHFTLEHVLLGQRSFCIFYTRENGTHVCDLFELNDTDQLWRVVACHAPADTARP